MGDTIDLGTTWSESTWNGSHWSGAHWSSAQWNSASWNAASWTGSDWNGATWSGSAWNGAHWSGSHWSGAHWSGLAWDGSHWSGSAWNGAHWSGAHWSGGSWGLDSDHGSQSTTSSAGSGSPAYPGYQLVSTNPDLWCPLGSNLGHIGNSGSAGKQNGGAGGPGEHPGAGTTVASAASAATATSAVASEGPAARVEPAGVRRRLTIRWRSGSFPAMATVQPAVAVVREATRRTGSTAARAARAEPAAKRKAPKVVLVAAAETPKVPLSAAPEEPVVPVADASCTTPRTGSRARLPEDMADKAATVPPERVVATEALVAPPAQLRTPTAATGGTEGMRLSRGVAPMVRRAVPEVCSPVRRESVAKTARMVRARQVDESCP